MPISPNTTIIIESKGDIVGFPPTRMIQVIPEEGELLLQNDCFLLLEDDCKILIAV